MEHMTTALYTVCVQKRDKFSWTSRSQFVQLCSVLHDAHKKRMTDESCVQYRIIFHGVSHVTVKKQEEGPPEVWTV